MKNILQIALIGLFALCMSSCDKDDEVLQPETYIVNGIQDVAFTRHLNTVVARQSLSLMVQYKTSAQEYVTLSLDSVPKGMGCSFTPAAGYAGFSSSLLLTDTSAAPGVYTLKLNAVGDHSAPRLFYFKVTVPDAPTCVDLLTGGYNGYSSCVAGAVSFYSMSKKAGVENILVFQDFLRSGQNIEMVINCSNSTLTIPAQNFMNNGTSYQATGSGTFSFSSHSRMYIDYTVKNLSSGAETSCMLNLSR